MNGGGGRQPIRARRRRGPESCRAFDRPSVSFRFVPFGGGVASGHRNGRSIAKRPMTSRPCGLPLSHIDTHTDTHTAVHTGTAQTPHYEAFYVIAFSSFRYGKESRRRL